MPNAVHRARELRRHAPLPERLLWSRLRSRALAAAKFRRQHPIGPWFADFACLELKLVIELDGDTHGTPEQQALDARRTAFLEREGWTVIRFWNSEMLENFEGTLDRIEDEIRFLRQR
jgi:very-short-patch-repair endonuclease